MTFTYRDLPLRSTGRIGRRKSEFAVIGFPSDLGATTDTGQADAVRAIIARSDPLGDSDSIAACGVVPPTRRDCVAYIQEVADNVADIAPNTRCVVAIGGDDSISLGVIEGLSSAYPDLAVLHYDAHTDMSDAGDPNHGNWVSFVRLRNIPVQQWGQRVSGDVASVHDPIAAKQPLVVVLDMDVIDPAYAPGVAVPYPLGCTPKELLEQVAADLEGRGRVVGIVLTEVAPSRDFAGITVHLACVLLERLMEMGHTRS